MTLVVFFSRGMSLEGWRRAGILDRELALYRELSPDLDRLAFVTYGGRDDGRVAEAMPRLDVLPNVWNLPSNLYSVLAPWLHRKYLRTASALRTNQINGGWCAVVAKWLFGTPLVVRCGFLWADNVERETTSPLRRRVSRALERKVFRSADRIVVASAGHAAAVAARYGVAPDVITVVPNYVDTRKFKLRSDVPREANRVTFVGRLEPEKNVDVLIEALAGLAGVELSIVGDGSRRAALEQQARALGVKAQFHGRVAHDDLPVLLGRTGVFVLPSQYEGNPKALVEAMASGAAVVGTRVSGIQEIIADGSNGLLSGPSADELRSVIRRLLEDAPLRERLAAAGLAYVQTHCTLTVAVERERAVLRDLVART